jgi:hypothetical protein
MPDGETWNTISGCSIVIINDKQFKELCEGQVKAREITPIVDIDLTEMEIGS